MLLSTFPSFKNLLKENSHLCAVQQSLILASGTVKEEVLHNWTYKRGTRNPRTWNVAPSAIMWNIWKEKNRTFEEVEQDFVKLQNSLIFSLFLEYL